MIERLEPRQLLSIFHPAMVESAADHDIAVVAPPALLASAGPRALSGGSFTLASGLLSAEFDVRALAVKSEVTVGLSRGSATTAIDLAAAVRFNRAGRIEANDGLRFAARRVLRYRSGLTYHAKLVLNVPARTYDAYVSVKGDVLVAIARGFRFSPHHPATAGLDHWSAPMRLGSAKVNNFRVTPIAQKLAMPPQGKLYHGVFPGGSNTWEDDITLEEVRAYEEKAGKQVAWVYFSHNWFGNRAFPTATATWIRQQGSVPYVRLMTLSVAKRPATGPDALFTLQRIIDGEFDSDLRAWANGAKYFSTPILAEWGPEFNGDWFNWNARWHGAGATDGFGDPTRPDGAEQFAAAYRHIVELMRSAGATNITWVWHANWWDGPEEEWNRLEEYYPGDDVVDWIGVSVYGPQRPTQNWHPISFREQMDGFYERVSALAPAKPVVISEFGATAGNPRMSAQAYAEPALADILARRWPRVVGFSWWNERWQNDSDPAWDPAIDTTMRLQDTAALARVFWDRLSGSAARVQERPVIA